MISVSRPLDYEQIPNGLIYLTVMAKDAGSPPLYSTVPVTIEVFVSIQEHWPYISRVGVVNASWRRHLCLVGKGCVPMVATVLNPAPSTLYHCFSCQGTCARGQGLGAQ